ncbi:MAG: AraC family transcriptional regulator [Maledivibacter sp.]|jgi:AraC-like DNA-binding protein|nr:AraC family transcriptional regulator [Maledivibacter sp.]
MQTFIDKVYKNFLKDNGYHHIKSNMPGYNFSLDKDLGKGHYCIYPVNNCFAVTSNNTQYKTAYTSKNYTPKCIGIGHYTASNPKDWFGSSIESGRQSIALYGDETIVELRVVPGDYINLRNIVILPEYYHQRIEPLTGLGIKEFAKIMTNTLTPWNEPPEFTQLINSISSLPYGSNYIDFILENKILGIIETILAYHEILNLNDSKIQANISDLNKLQLVKAHIDKHFNENIRIEELVQLAYMSKSKLYQLFKEKEGITITYYIQQQRTNSAKKLLVTTDLPLSLVAKQVGYACHSSFSEVFKSRVGMTPSQFRKAFFLDK